MDRSKFNKKLEKYLRKIEIDTGRQIEIRELPPAKLYRMKSAFVHHPTNILILLAAGSDPNDPEIVQSIAHEATHGLLAYKMKYCLGFFKGTPSAHEKKLVTLSFTMVSDIVVNKILQKEGFLPYSPRYPNLVKEEIKEMQSGRVLYNQFSNDPSYWNKHLVFRYILAWGYTKYIDLEEKVHEILVDFMNVFKLKYTEQIQEIMDIQGIILVKEIFSAEGYKRAIEKLLNLWRLDELVELKTV